MVFVRLLASCALLGAAGCASVSTADGERLPLASGEFRAYVERVFREQNGVADELAFALEAPGAERAELQAAERDLLDACEGVNELATARRDQQRVGMRRGSRAARTVPQCEEATRAAAAVSAADRAARSSGRRRGSVRQQAADRDEVLLIVRRVDARDWTFWPFAGAWTNRPSPM